MGLLGSLVKLLVVGVSGLVSVMLIRTFTFPSKQPNVGKCSPEDADFIKLTDEMITHFQDAIKIKSISWTIEQMSLPEILEFHKHLEKSFPLIHSSKLVKKEVINTYSLLYTVQASDMSLKPYMLAGHMDVVPVDQQDWDVPPFEGQIVDGFLYGRGTIDNKNTVMGIMEALEFRLKNGILPVRPLYIAFGHDEEVLGMQGAGEIKKVLESRNVQVEFLLDEGTTVVQGVFGGIKTPIALISVAEKGAATVNISVDAVPSGHSSMPGKETNIGVLAKALSRIEENPFPSMFGRGPERSLLEAIATEASFPLKFVLTNLWFFSPVASWMMSLKPSSNALVRTTTAVTMVNGGTKMNVLPPSAWGVVNHRIHPAQSIEEVIEYDHQLIGDDRVKIDRLGLGDILPSPISPHGDDVFGYQVIARSVNQVFPSAIVAPGLMIGNTDTKMYWNLTKQIYRFCPTFMLPSDLPRFHGINERMSLENYQQTINVYYHVMVNADSKDLSHKHSHSEDL
ncbi:N-fatty-acyl-amino acid synthase/hydrolase PM20D1.2 [Holothuria leucospilota]|uniref:N-fatty-acyl-amino acid synthase/hydrolase PM20D1.2 n=1 Tax=Holothuria leucospilota TaxID=206669 RepID=A0A9Q1CK75_HOLLE|nr:N-fatty-acyl-amino acid synthase/hydrolase PM20D1.2 [Holothuria leucospilota]